MMLNQQQPCILKLGFFFINRLTTEKVEIEDYPPQNPLIAFVTGVKMSFWTNTSRKTSALNVLESCWSCAAVVHKFMTSAASVTVNQKLWCEPASVASQVRTAMLHFYSTSNVVKIEISRDRKGDERL